VLYGELQEEERMNSDQKIKRVRVTVTHVHTNGFAFAGDTFIPANVYEKIGKPSRGETIVVEVVRSTRGKTTYTAIAPKEKSDVQWQNWQIGKGQIEIPNTFPGSDHDRLTFACFKCGAGVCEGSDIWKIKSSCLWTRSVGMVKRGKRFENKFKGTVGFEALCITCDFIVGSIYPHAFVSTTDEEDMDTDRPVPTAKLYITREQQNTSELLNNIVLTGVETLQTAKLVLENLTKKDGYTGPRVTSSTFNLIRENERLKKEQKSETEKCSICTEPGRGYKCFTEGCFTCNDCFARHVVAFTGIEDIGRLKNADGQLPCPMKCGHFLRDEDIAVHAPGKPHRQYMEARLSIATMEGREEERHQVQEEERRVAKLSEEDKRFRGYRKKITEDLLTLKCPRCSQAFVDFDGCYALSCSKCKCSFCAYCLKDCGSDAHGHVVRCPESPSKDIYGNHDFETVQTAHKKKSVVRFLEKLPKADKERVIDENRDVLEEFNIRNTAPKKVIATGLGVRQQLPDNWVFGGIVDEEDEDMMQQILAMSILDR
jgi:hypothetical protein